ncbi:hypothetical protein LCGC14_1216210 [marine sediment metagenome]|uniref:Uncharacterized protein n=1 Tax=marine sediment metagenome TaxID=412755 RepID=A0A0F9LGR2_9ZZZZ
MILVRPVLQLAMVIIFILLIWHTFYLMSKLTFNYSYFFLSCFRALRRKASKSHHREDFLRLKLLRQINVNFWKVFKSLSRKTRKILLRNWSSHITIENFFHEIDSTLPSNFLSDISANLSVSLLQTMVSYSKAQTLQIIEKFFSKLELEQKKITMFRVRINRLISLFTKHKQINLSKTQIWDKFCLYKDLPIIYNLKKKDLPHKFNRKELQNVSLNDIKAFTSITSEEFQELVTLMMNSFTNKINSYMEVKFIKQDTLIFVGGKEFRQCKYLVLDISTEDYEMYDEINSIDEAIDIYEEQVSFPRPSPLEEFKGHCSNLQTWFENGYNTQILHSNLSFPLLKALSKAGDPQANKIFKDEIAIRLASGYPSTILYLLNNEYDNYLTQEEYTDILQISLDSLNKYKTHSYYYDAFYLITEKSIIDEKDTSVIPSNCRFIIKMIKKNPLVLIIFIKHFNLIMKDYSDVGKYASFIIFHLKKLKQDFPELVFFKALTTLINNGIFFYFFSTRYKVIFSLLTENDESKLLERFLRSFIQKYHKEPFFIFLVPQLLKKIRFLTMTGLLSTITGQLSTFIMLLNYLRENNHLSKPSRFTDLIGEEMTRLLKSLKNEKIENNLTLFRNLYNSVSGTTLFYNKINDFFDCFDHIFTKEPFLWISDENIEFQELFSVLGQLITDPNLKYQMEQNLSLYFEKYQDSYFWYRFLICFFDYFGQDIPFTEFLPLIMNNITGFTLNARIRIFNDILHHFRSISSISLHHCEYPDIVKTELNYYLKYIKKGSSVEKAVEAWVLLLYGIRDTKLLDLKFLKIKDCLKSIVRRINKHPSELEPHTIDNLSTSIAHIKNRLYRTELKSLLRALDPITN